MTDGPMRGAALLDELLARLAVATGAELDLRGDELACWPADVVKALYDSRVLVPAGPAAAVVCPGCERACMMPVQVRARPGGMQQAFVVCDQRNDIGRVPVTLEALERWRFGAGTLADALAGLLGGDAAMPMTGAPADWRLGVVSGRQARAAAMLRNPPDGLHVELAGHRLELAALLSVKDGVLVFDVRSLARCVDNPVPGAGAGESPQERRERLRARVAQLKQAGNKAFLKQLATEEGVSPSRVKQLLAEKDRPPSWADPVKSAAQPRPGAVSKKSANKR